MLAGRDAHEKTMQDPDIPEKKNDIDLMGVGNSILHLLTPASSFENIRFVSAPDVSAGYLGIDMVYRESCEVPYLLAYRR